MTRRLIPLLIVGLLASSALASCADNPDTAEPGPLRVVATMAPVGALVQVVGGDDVGLVVLAGSGIDPHEYEVTAGNRRAIEGARLIFRNGLGIDDFLDKAIASDSATVTTLTDGLLPAYASTGNPDPHVWHDPAYDQAMVAKIGDVLAAADPARADRYRQRATAYIARLEAVDGEVREILAAIPAANRKMVTNHDGFGYFTARYGLTFVGAVIPAQTTQAEPSARDIRDLVELIRSEGVKAIFAESSIDPKVARQIASDTGVKVVDNLYVDTMGPPGSGADTIDGLLLINARTIAEALR